MATPDRALDPGASRRPGRVKQSNPQLDAMDAEEVIARHESPEAFPVIICDGNRVLAKRWVLDENGEPVPDRKGKHPYRFKVYPWVPQDAGVAGIRGLIEDIAYRPRFAVVRGSLRSEHVTAETVLRRSRVRHGDPRAPEGSDKRLDQPAYFRDAPNGRSWICVDVDDMRCPSRVHPWKEPVAALEYVRSKLPPPFRGAASVCQWSASMLLGRTAGRVLKAHLWFWLTEPMKDCVLKPWAHKDPEARHVDDALFSAVQVHYTAAPVLGEGVEDPFGPDTGRDRIVMLPGTTDEVDLLPYVKERMKKLERRNAEARRRSHAQKPTQDPGEQPGSSSQSETGSSSTPTNIESANLSKSTREFLVGGAPDGERNKRLFAAACDMAGCGVRRGEAKTALLDAAARCAPPMEADEATATIDSAWGSPREPARPSGGGGSQPSPPEVGTEQWFAELLVQKHGSDLRFVGKWKKWMIWLPERRIWASDDTGEVMRRAYDVAATDVVQIAREYAAIVAQTAKAEGGGGGGGGSDSEGDDNGERTAQAIIRKFQQRTPLQNGVALAAAYAVVVATHEQWDRDRWLFHCANGSLDLRSNELRDPRRADYITKRSPVAYLADAEAPTWSTFLERILPEPDVRDYVQRLGGYCLTGDVVEHVLHFLVGSGANGKTTFIEAIKHAMGDYAGTAPSSLLMASRGERHPTDQTLLFGRRAIFSSETPEGGKLDENLMKQLTGGDTITARRMREDFWSFEPTHKLIIATNHRPRIVGTDEGVWRRLRLIPFAVTIPPEERDGQLPEKLRVEAPGILAWLVRGLLAYRERGLDAPEAVRVATEEYRGSEDVLGEFLQERTTSVPGAFLPSAALYQAYTGWCSDNGTPDNRRLTQRNLTLRLKERGLDHVHTRVARGFRGLALVDPWFGDASVTLGAASSGEAAHANHPSGKRLVGDCDAVTLDARIIDQPAPAHTRTHTHADIPEQASQRHQASQVSGDAGDDGRDGDDDGHRRHEHADDWGEL